ncbi:Mut7-C RNAse domain-containing protein [Thermodesulfobacteriota bacterium]
MTTATFTFHGYLQQLLKRELRAVSPLLHHFDRRASIKDVIESLGIPHPVIGTLTVNKLEVGFDYILLDHDMIEATSLTPPVDPFIPTILRPRALDKIAFIVDVNAGRLALFLRMLGFDTVYGNDIKNGRLAEIAQSDNRILLTRDTTLLKRKIIMHGYLLREQNPSRQLVDVVRLYDLDSRIRPLSRCIPCNGLLVPVSKKVIMDRLEPLTRKHYHSFHICKDCKRIYWPGSHHGKILAFIDGILESVRQDYFVEG